MLSSTFLSIAVVFFLLPRPVRSAFGRRGSDPPAGFAKPSQKQGHPVAALPHHHIGGHWSSTGSEGLDHTTVEPVKATSRRPAAPGKDEDHKSSPEQVPYVVGERHPYASGVFTLDPTFGMF
jgi:hypothetical protein